MRKEIEELKAAVEMIRQELDEFYNTELQALQESPEDYRGIAREDFLVYWAER